MVFGNDCWHVLEFQRVTPGLFEVDIAGTSVTTMAARVGFDKFLRHVLSLREGPSQLEENHSSIVVDRNC